MPGGPKRPREENSGDMGTSTLFTVLVQLWELGNISTEDVEHIAKAAGEDIDRSNFMNAVNIRNNTSVATYQDLDQLARHEDPQQFLKGSTIEWPWLPGHYQIPMKLDNTEPPQHVDSPRWIFPTLVCLSGPMTPP